MRVVCIVVVFLCLLFANDAKGQSPFDRNVNYRLGFLTEGDRLGLKAGVVYSGNEQGFGTNTAVNISIQEEWYLGDWVSFAVNIGYMEKSFQYGFPAINDKQAIKLNTTLNFFYLDYLLKFKKNTNGWCPNVFLGPRVDFIIGEDSEDFHNRFIGSTNKDTGSFGLTYGVGLERPVGALILGIAVSHYYDLSTNYGISIIEISPRVEKNFKQNAFAIDFIISYELD